MLILSCDCKFSFTCKLNSFPNKCLSTRAHFEKEAKGYLEIAHCTPLWFTLGISLLEGKECKLLLAYLGFFAPWIHQPILRLRHHPCETLSFHDEVERLQGSRWSLGILGLFQALCDTPRQKPREQLWIVVGHSPVYRGGAISKMLWVVLRRLSLEFFLSLSLSERRYQKKSTSKIEQALKLRVQFVISCDMIVFSFFTISGQLTLKVNLKINQTAIKQSWNFYLDCVISPGQVFPCMFGKAGFVSFFVCRKHSNKLHKESGNFHI